MKIKTTLKETRYSERNKHSDKIYKVLHNKYFRRAAIAFIMCVASAANAQTINTIAGNGIYGYFGDGGQATAAEFSLPSGIALDALGNVYTGDHYNSCVRMISTSGVIYTVAGNGVHGYSGDGGQATDAELFWPTGVGTDANGNLYIADYDNNVIRKVNSSGIISTFAGTGGQSFGGDGGQATAAQFYAPTGVWVDLNGNVYIADHVNGRIRVVNTSGIIHTIAGNGGFGYSGDGVQATATELCWPTDAIIDSHGNIFIADQYNNRVRMVNTAGVISTFAGNGYNRPYNGGYSGDGGQATAAELYWPTSLVFDKSGDLLIADSGNNCIRMVNTLGVISTVVGNGFSSYYGDGGPATAAELMGPEGVTMDSYGNIYLTDTYNYRIREVTGIPSGMNAQVTIENSQINIYPIPNNGKFIVTGMNAGQKVELYNYMGQTVLSKLSGNNPEMQFDISGNADGIYFMRVVDKNGAVVDEKKIVKVE